MHQRKSEKKNLMDNHNIFTRLLHPGHQSVSSLFDALQRLVQVVIPLGVALKGAFTWIVFTLVFFHSLFLSFYNAVTMVKVSFTQLCSFASTFIDCFSI